MSVRNLRMAPYIEIQEWRWDTSSGSWNKKRNCLQSKSSRITSTIDKIQQETPSRREPVNEIVSIAAKVTDDSNQKKELEQNWSKSLWIYSCG